MFAAISPADVHARKQALYANERAKLLGHPLAPSAAEAVPTRGKGAWYEDPVALGSLLIMFPPIGLAALWTSKRYSNDARWALTVMTALTMCLMSALLIAVLAMH